MFGYTNLLRRSIKGQTPWEEQSHNDAKSTQERVPASSSEAATHKPPVHSSSSDLEHKLTAICVKKRK